MKIVNFVRLLMTAIVESASGAVAPVVLSSEKLTALKESYKAAYKEMVKIEDPFSVEAKNAKIALWKIGGEITSEEAAILKGINDAKIAEMRNQRLKLNENQFITYDAMLAVRADKKATDEQKAAAQTAFETAKELVNNELLAKYASSKPAKVKTGETEKNTDKTANTSVIIEMFLSGKSHKEIEEAGYKRSTVWHAINNYKKANQ